MLCTRNPELDRLGPRSDEEMATFECGAIDRHRVSASESCMTVVGVDVLLGVAVFTLLRNRIRECALEGDQRRPVDLDIASHAVVVHAHAAVHRLGAGDQPLLRIAAPQRTGATEGPKIDDRDAPAGSTRTAAWSRAANPKPAPARRAF